MSASRRARELRAWSTELSPSGRIGLQDANLATRLNIVDAPLSLKPLVGDKGQRLSGDASWEAVITEAVKRVRKMGCFIVGTPVHTKEGLKPIEQVEVGDLVLSKPDNGQGEASYQPVTRTFRFEDREVYLIPFTELDPLTRRVVRVETDYVIGTGGHPIWVEQLEQYRFGNEGTLVTTPINQWMSVEEFYFRCVQADAISLEVQLTTPDAIVSLSNGAPAIMSRPAPILQGEAADIGLQFPDTEDWAFEPTGRAIRFTDAGFVKDGRVTGLEGVDRSVLDYSGYDCDGPYSIVKRSGGYLPMRRTVYNIEVANNHSYFVGKTGLWVHNTSGDVAKLGVPLRPTQAL